MYKPNINMDPEGHYGSEITFDEKVSNKRVSLSHSFQLVYNSVVVRSIRREVIPEPV